MKQNAIKTRKNHIGYFVLFTNTKMIAQDIFGIYKQKDVVENAFKAIYVTPKCKILEGETSARVFLAKQTEKTTSGINDINEIVLKCLP